MNKCLMCTNMHKQKTASGNYRITCAVNRDVVLFGEVVETYADGRREVCCL